jgi:RNA polymerase sigma factor (TIGR02999 family)
MGIGDITGLLDRWNAGDQAAMQELLVLVYDELRRMADRFLRQERPDHTLQPTALVNELFLRFSGLREMRVESQRHFYGAAANAMRRILVDHARHRKAEKRGGTQQRRISIEDVPEDAFAGVDQPDFERLDDALKALAAIAPEKAQAVELRYFAGLSVDETARVMGISPATVGRHWAFARAWLHRELARTDAERPAAEEGADRGHGRNRLERG